MEKKLPSLPLGRHVEESTTTKKPSLDFETGAGSFLAQSKNQTFTQINSDTRPSNRKSDRINSRTMPQGMSSRRPDVPMTLDLRSYNGLSQESISSPPLVSASSPEDTNFLKTPIELENIASSNSFGTLKPMLLPINTSYRKNVVVHQQPTDNIISARSLSLNQEASPIETKSLNRRNRKQLTLETMPENTYSDHGEGINMDVKDPERRIDTNELIENIKNLELGLEYQMSISADELVALKKLGSGQSGTVSKVLHLPTQKTMARKIVHLEAKEVIQSQIMRELRIMHECDSPFIIEFYGTFMHEGNVVICMEYADCGSLSHVFKLTGPFPEFMLKHVAFSVLSGLTYLYETHRIIHRDVKPSNVLLTSKGKIKLCDFGVSRELINSLADTFVGTSTYMSPERIQGGVYSVKGDVWSLGIMLYELASGNLAFSNDGSGQTSILELLQRIVNEKPPTLSVKDGFSENISDFVSQCLKKENQRPTPSDLMKHPFLADFLDTDGVRVNSKYRGDIRKWCKNVRRVQKGKPLV